MIKLTFIQNKTKGERREKRERGSEGKWRGNEGNKRGRGENEGRDRERGK